MTLCSCKERDSIGLISAALSRSAGFFPKQELVIEPRDCTAFEKHVILF